MIWVVVNCLYWGSLGATGQCVFPDKAACLARTDEIRTALKMPAFGPPFCFGRSPFEQATKQEIGNPYPAD